MGVVIAVASNKGGVGKTCFSVNIAHALATQKKKVLTVDNDSQCNLTTLLLAGTHVKLNSTLYELLLSPEKTDITSCIYQTQIERVFCLPNVEETSAIEPELLKRLPGSYRLLQEALRQKKVADSYDYVIIDTPPTLGFFPVLALMAADFVVVPIAAGSVFSFDGLRKAMNLIEDIQNDGNSTLKFMRLLVNKVDLRTSISKNNLDLLKSNVTADQMFATHVPINTMFEKAEALGTTILRYGPSSTGAQAYRDLAKEIIEIVDGTPREAKKPRKARKATQG